jgi:hypothetical protein
MPDNFTIFEGTSEIQRMIIGRAVTGLDVRGSETSPTGNQWWQRIPDHGPDQGRGL